MGIVRHVARNVRRSRDGAMIRRRVGLGLGRAPTCFHRIKSHPELATPATAPREGETGGGQRELGRHFEPRCRDGAHQGRLRSDLEDGDRYVGISPLVVVRRSTHGYPGMIQRNTTRCRTNRLSWWVRGQTRRRSPT